MTESKLQPIYWRDDRIFIIDQTKLPFCYQLLTITTPEELVAAIKQLSIRGAPALGIAAAFGITLGLKDYRTASYNEFSLRFAQLSELFLHSRPTAVNIRWSIERLDKIVKTSTASPPETIWNKLLHEAQTIQAEDLFLSRLLAENGLALIPAKAKLMTHCNTGGLATGGYGTALGIIFRAHQQGYDLHVYVNETRPLLQGARLTAWELKQWGIPFTLITDNMAAYVMQTVGIDAVLVGADRIARNGDTANKIGTYALAIQAAYHRVPFYVVAPFSSVDLTTADGRAIEIEQRAPTEVTRVMTNPIVPDDYPALSPAFDVTPAKLISAIITEKGVYRYPYNLAEK